MSEDRRHTKVDEMLDRALQAVNDGDRATASVLADRVLALDRGNTDAEDLLAAPVDQGEIRRLTIFFADLVDSTELSTRIEPEIYRTVVGRYKDVVRKIVDRYEGHIGSTKGDGLLGVFGHPRAHENDAARAVHAGLEITREVSRLSAQVKKRFGFEIQVRVGVHRGVVYLDLDQDDVYGLAANMAARVSGLAAPDSVVVSAPIYRVVRDDFVLEQLPARTVKGIREPVEHYRVVEERVGDPHRTTIGPLIGRENEIEHLRDAWNHACAGDLGCPGVLFHGEAGIGKSRLALAAAQLAERSGHPVITLQGSPLHGDVGLRPVRRLLEKRCGITASMAPAERLQRLTGLLHEQASNPTLIVPVLAPVLGIPPQAGYQPITADGPKLLRQILDGVSEYLWAGTRGEPAMVLVEDMHWFDEDTEEVVWKLLDHASGRLLIVMTSRTDLGESAPSGVARFTLQPLTPAETDELTAALAPHISDADRTAVRSRCDGIPLYIEEVVAKLDELSSQDNESAAVPDSLYEALFARLRSNKQGGKVIEAAAVMGSRIDRDLLDTVVELDEADMDEAIRQLVDGHVLVFREDGNLRFRHELLREVAVELAPPSARRRIHGRVADALVEASQSGNTDWPLVASHYASAERFTEAAAAYGRASADARRRGAIHESRNLLSRAIAQTERCAPGPERDHSEIGLRLRRGFLSYATEGATSPSTSADFERCLELATTTVSENLFSTLTALYGYYATRADLVRAQQVMDAVDTGVVDGEPAEWPTATAGFGMLHWYRGEFDAARQKLEVAAATRDRVGSAVMSSWFMANEPIASIHTHLALARYIQGDLAGAEDEFVNTAARSDEVGVPQGPFSLAYARHLEVLMRIDAGQWRLAAQVADQMTSDAMKFGLDSWVAMGHAQQAVVAALLSLPADEPGADGAALETHIATITAIIDGWRGLELKVMLPTYDAVLARLLICAGRPAAARERLDLGLQLAAETGMHYYDAELLRLRARTQPDQDAVQTDLRNALTLARSQGATIFELNAAVDEFDLLGDAARPTLHEAVSKFPDGSSWPLLPQARALLR